MRFRLPLILGGVGIFILAAVILANAFWGIGGSAVSTIGDSIGLGNKYAGDWDLELSFKMNQVVPGMGHSEMTGQGAVSINIPRQKNAKIAGEGIWNDSFSGASYAAWGARVEGRPEGKISVMGKVIGDKFVFSENWEGTNCPWTASAGPYNFSGNTCEGYGSGENYEIELKDGATAAKEYNYPEAFMTLSQTWKISRKCKDQVPELKSQVEQIINTAITTNEEPAKTHEKLVNLAAQNIPIGKSFKDSNECVKVVGYSVDLQYKIGDREDKIYKIFGDTNGGIHKIISGTVDKMTTRGGVETQVFYQAAIDISLNPS